MYIMKSYTLERERYNECVYWLDVWQDCENRVSNKSPGRRIDTIRIQREINTSPLCICNTDLKSIYTVNYCYKGKKSDLH